MKMSDKVQWSEIESGRYKIRLLLREISFLIHTHGKKLGNASSLNVMLLKFQLPVVWRY